MIPSRKQCAGVDVSLCSLSIRLDSEVLTHPEIPIPMGTCPRKAGPALVSPRPLSPPPSPLPGPLVLLTARCWPPLGPLELLRPPLSSAAPQSPRRPINSAVSRYAQFAVALKYTDFKAHPPRYNAQREPTSKVTVCTAPSSAGRARPLAMPNFWGCILYGGVARARLRARDDDSSRHGFIRMTLSVSSERFSNWQSLRVGQSRIIGNIRCVMQ